MKRQVLILSIVSFCAFVSLDLLANDMEHGNSGKRGGNQDYTPPKGYIYCAMEDRSYSFNQRVDVAYGVNGTFKFLYGVKGTITFNNDTFGGDPAPGQGKRGYYKAYNGNGPGNNNGNNGSTGNILPLGYNWVADENRSYTFNQRVDLAYGVEGSYRFIYGVSGTVRFDNETFGGDPAPDRGKKGYYKIASGGNYPGGGAGSGLPADYSWAADEDKSKTFYQRVDLAYGANGSYKYLYGITGTVTFNNETFGGDPAPNTGKKGYYRISSGGRPGGGGSGSGLPNGYNFAADEDRAKYFNQRVDLAYGANGSYKYLYGVTGNITFNNQTFGGDPAPNMGKKGYYRIASGNNNPGNTLPQGFVWAADEDKSKTFYQKVDVAYGVDGSYKYRYGVTGTITFSNDYFGGDPAPNKAKKGYYRVSR